MIGPPLAYALAMGFSFTVMYLSAAVAFVVCGVMVWLFLPSMSKNVPLATGAVEARAAIDATRCCCLLSAR